MQGYVELESPASWLPILGITVPWKMHDTPQNMCMPCGRMHTWRKSLQSVQMKCAVWHLSLIPRRKRTSKKKLYSDLQGSFVHTLKKTGWKSIKKRLRYSIFLKILMIFQSKDVECSVESVSHRHIKVKISNFFSTIICRIALSPLERKWL